MDILRSRALSMWREGERPQKQVEFRSVQQPQSGTCLDRWIEFRKNRNKVTSIRTDGLEKYMVIHPCVSVSANKIIP